MGQHFTSPKLSVTVLLPSGSGAEVSIPVNSTLGELKVAAQKSLGRSAGFLRLVRDGRLLDSQESVQSLQLQEGDTLCAVASVPTVCANPRAFAVYFRGGGLVSWGNDGDASRVQERLINVQDVQATDAAFAALLGDRTVVTWGHRHCGGDTLKLQDRLKDVRSIHANSGAFTALLEDGTVVAWGLDEVGGYSGRIEDELHNVRAIHSMQRGFLAVRTDGRAVTWGGEALMEGEMIQAPELRNVQAVYATDRGDAPQSALVPRLEGVQKISATKGAFAAQLRDGRVATWGLDSLGGDSSLQQGSLQAVTEIYATHSGAFAALRADGRVVTWGNQTFGGSSFAVQDLLYHVQEIHSTHWAFLALRSDGQCVTWGHPDRGGDCRDVQQKLQWLM
ncbi:unnamed protein product [Durusdinium trenchii]|uniref:Ubiquitin-like domain-containing protein n=1 Tax=Durusdinium trenchii TaxID=1381693 RepID=A0ABP0J3G9_9DINO